MRAKLDVLQSMCRQWSLAPSQESIIKSSKRSDCTLTKRIHFALFLPVYSTYSEAWATLVSYSCSVLLHACCILLLWGHVPYVAAAVNTILPKLDQGVYFQTTAALNCIT